MDTVLRAVAVYAFVLLIFRIGGRRTFAEMTAFDFVFLLIVAEATQQALLGQDMSVINCWIVVATLIILDIGLSLAKVRWARLELWIDGTSTVLLADGKMFQDRMRKARVDEEDILHAARELHGLERLDQVKYAVLEKSGGITIIPAQQQ
jgi:uncharacterized membrane protein YcaP (DUF421 family)